MEPSGFNESRETIGSSEAGETPDAPDAEDGRPADDVGVAPASPAPLEHGQADFFDVRPSVARTSLPGSPGSCPRGPWTNRRSRAPLAEGTVGEATPLEDPFIEGTVGEATPLEDPFIEGTVGDGTSGEGTAIEEPFIEETVGDATFAYDTQEQGSSADLTAAGEPVPEEPSDGPGPFAGVTVLAETDGDGRVPDESADRHRFFDDGPTGDDLADHRASFADQPVDDDSASGALRERPSLEAGTEPAGDAEVRNLTVVDGWATPEATDELSERPADDGGADPWAWSPEPEVAAEPAATWFPEAVLNDVPLPTTTTCRRATRGVRGLDDPGSSLPGPHDDRAGPAPDPSDPGAGRSTIFQPTGGWSSTADPTPASEPWSVWGPGAADGVGAGSPPVQPSTWKPAWQAEPQSHHPTPAVWESPADPAASPWRVDGPQSGPEPVGAPSPPQSPATGSDPVWGSAWQPPDPVGWGSPSGDEPGAWIPSAREPGSDRETSVGTDPTVGADTEAPGAALTAAAGPGRCRARRRHLGAARGACSRGSPRPVARSPSARCRRESVRRSAPAPAAVHARGRRSARGTRWRLLTGRQAAQVPPRSASVLTSHPSVLVQSPRRSVDTCSVANPPPRTLRDHLVATGVITREQLAWAEGQPAGPGGLATTLLTAGLVTEGQLVAAAAERLGLEFVDLDKIKPDPRLSRRLPEAAARQVRAVPVSEDAQGLVVATADAHRLPETLAWLATQAGVPVRAVAAAPGAVDRYLGRLYAQPLDTQRASASPLDRLLATVIDQGGSDLHLSVGKPPGIRVDGHLWPVEGSGRSSHRRRPVTWSLSGRWERRPATAVRGGP